MQLLMFSYGGTRRSLPVCLVGPRPSGSCSSWWNTICSLLSATASFYRWRSCSFGPMRAPSSTSEILSSFPHCICGLKINLLVWRLIFLAWILNFFSCATDCRSPPRIPEVSIPEDVAVNVALSLRYEINRGFTVLRDIASGRDLKKFLVVCCLVFLKNVSGSRSIWMGVILIAILVFQVIAGLWVLSIVGSCCNFLALFYIGKKMFWSVI